VRRIEVPLLAPPGGAVDRSKNATAAAAAAAALPVHLHPSMWTGTQNWQTAEQEATRLEEQREGERWNASVKVRLMVTPRQRKRKGNRNRKSSSARSVVVVARFMSGDSDRTED